jgi:hypothetical protein
VACARGYLDQHGACSAAAETISEDVAGFGDSSRLPPATHPPPRAQSSSASRFTAGATCGGRSSVSRYSARDLRPRHFDREAGRTLLPRVDHRLARIPELEVLQHLFVCHGVADAADDGQESDVGAEPFERFANLLDDLPLKVGPLAE